MQSQTLPNLWLFSDARNDAVLEMALAKLPASSGFIFRHYHLSGEERRRRFEALKSVAQSLGHLVIVPDSAENAQEWGADGVYGGNDNANIYNDGDTLDNTLTRLATAHNAHELRAAAQAGADGVFLSPVFPTRSHPGAQTLGVLGFHVLAQQVDIPVIALGGMTADRAKELDWPRWGAIDGLV